MRCWRQLLLLTLPGRVRAGYMFNRKTVKPAAIDFWMVLVYIIYVCMFTFFQGVQ